MKRIYRGLILFLVVIIPFALVSCKSSSAETDSDTAPGDIETADTAAAKGDEIEIVLSTASQDLFGGWVVHALITNNADYTVGNAELEFIAHGGDGSAVFNETIYTLPYGLSPGEEQPFSIRLPLSITAIDDFEFNILNLYLMERNTVQLDQGVFRMVSAENGVVTLLGEISNNAGLPAVIRSARAVLFSTDGEIINSAACDVCARYLSTGKSSPMSFSFYGHQTAAEIDHYEIYLSTETADSIGMVDVEFLEPVHAYVDDAGTFHLLGDLKNTGEEILDLSLLGTFYNAAGELVGVSSTNLPVSSLLPGESSPYEMIIFAPLDLVADWSLQVDLSRSRKVDTPSLELNAQEVLVTPEEYKWVISGDAVNDSDQDLTMVLIMAGLRDTSTGELIGLSYTLEAGEFPIGSLISYNLIISPNTALDPATLNSFVIVKGR